ncbi:MAG: tetratricopeptide repeat protein [Deltaproteobacteria bacterium]|nr:MAG: tetratricopeptide repeat protein [Deltaproteobacteria bacterium]
MSKESIIEAAEKLIAEGKYDKAIKEYERLVQDDPADMRAKLKVGDLYAKKKDVPNAIKIYKEVAETYTKENFSLKAIAVYKTILKLSPTMVEVNEKLGDLYHQVGLQQDAVNQYYIVASFFDNKGKTKEAIEIRKKIIQADPSNATGRIRLAELMQVEGDNQNSYQEYERASEILLKKNDREGLAEIYEKMIFYKPDNVELLLKLGKIYFEKRDFKKALRRIESAQPGVKQDIRIQEIWSESLLEDHQVDAARKKFKELYESALRVKDVELTARVYSRVLQEFGDDQDYLNEYAELQKEAGSEQAKVSPKYREDFEKTDTGIDLRQFDEYMKKKT